MAQSKSQPKTQAKIATEVRKPKETLEVPEKIEPIPIPDPVVTAPVAPSGTCVDWINQAGITDVANAFILINRESGCRVNATNASSGAYGIPQALPGGKMASMGDDWQTNPVTQLRWMQDYVVSRYGSWANAVGFSNANGWY